jgi:hypothetical protein
MHAHAEHAENLCHELRAIAEGLVKNPPRRIGYRQRVQIERPLFLTLKDVCRRRLGYDLHGLSEAHRRGLESAVKNSPAGHQISSLLREAFELRTFLLDLSSADPYVQGDALSRASVTHQDAPRTLAHALCRLAELIEQQIGEQGASPLPSALAGPSEGAR